MERIGLKQAIAALRKELSESILASANEKLRFEVGEITLEIQVEVERSVGGSGGVNLWVVELGAQGARTSTNTHKITIPLKPIKRSGEPVLTGGDEIPE